MMYEDDRVAVHTARPGPREDRGFASVEATPDWVFDFEDARAAVDQCPLCLRHVFDEDAGRYCPHCLGDVQAAGGWR